MVVELSGALAALGVQSEIFATDLAGPASTRRGQPLNAWDLPARAVEVPVRLFAARPPYRLAFSPGLHSALAREMGSFDIVHIH